MVDISPESLQEYINRPAAELPTPAFVLSKPTLERNCKRLHEDVRNLGIEFRPHVKTLKSEEVTRLMLGGVAKGCVASTLREIRGLLPLVKEGLVKEVLYGIPIRPGSLPALYEIFKTVKILLMVDHISQIDAIEAFTTNSPATPWPIFIKTDIGAQDRRAGITPTSPRLSELLARAAASPSVLIEGFYAHAGHSYDARSPAAAAEVLHAECGAAVAAAAQLPASAESPITISFGATPTAHVVGQLKKDLPPHLRLELHAGNYVANDLQQLGTGCIEPQDMAVRVLTEVCSLYPERNEALVNAGVIALGREPGPIPGYGRVVGREEWVVGKVSQEHGILRPVEQGAEGKVEECFEVGQKVFLHVQHACIAAAAHFVYFVVDEGDVVREIWQPWKGW